MDTALVIGASGGIGSAVVEALRGRGVAVTTLSRSEDGFDVTDPGAVERGLAGLDGPYDLIFVAVGTLAAGGDPEKALDAIDKEQFEKVFAINAIGPALILRHLPGLLARDEGGKVAVLSARVGSIGDNKIGGWYSYRASKAALNQIVHGAAVELGRSHKGVTVLALHPGTVETAFTAGYKAKKVSADEAAENLLRVIDDAGPEQSGGFYDYAGEEIPW